MQLNDILLYNTSMENDYDRYAFDAVFRENFDGSLTPIRTIKVNGVLFGSDISFSKGVAFGGVDFHLYKNRDIAAKEEDGTLTILGFFKESDTNQHVQPTS